MKQSYILSEKGPCKWTVLYDDDKTFRGYIDTNEYMISYNGEHLITDPGGFIGFPAILSSLINEVDISNVNAAFLSHQDPDISSSLSLWLDVNPEIKAYVPKIWETFMPHYGGQNETFLRMPDEGMTIPLNELKLDAIPAHFMHSAGNMHLYDPYSKILFSGDTGAAIFSNGGNHSIFVEDFNEHTALMEGFHKRWFCSNEFKNRWCDQVSQMQIKMICPQHGKIFRDDDVKRFIEWLYQLQVGHIGD